MIDSVSLRFSRTDVRLNPLPPPQPLHEMSAALVHSLRSCGTLLVLIATVWFGYSMVGVELFGGKFYFCT